MKNHGGQGDGRDAASGMIIIIIIIIIIEFI